MKFTLVTVGRSKFPFIAEGMRHYAEAISHFAQWEVVELKDQNHLRDPEVQRAKEAEAFAELFQRRKWIQDGKIRTFFLDEAGKGRNSREFAAQLSSARDQGVAHFVFVIGGAHGFTAQAKKEQVCISLSPLTFPHDLTRLIAAEQVYRALNIMAGTKYHHD